MRLAIDRLPQGHPVETVENKHFPTIVAATTMDPGSSNTRLGHGTRDLGESIDAFDRETRLIGLGNKVVGHRPDLRAPSTTDHFHAMEVSLLRRTEQPSK